MGFTTNDNISTKALPAVIGSAGSTWQAAPVPNTTLFLVGKQSASERMLVLPRMISTASGINHPVSATVLPLLQVDAAGLQSTLYKDAVTWLPVMRSSGTGGTVPANASVLPRPVVSEASGLVGTIGEAQTTFALPKSTAAGHPWGDWEAATALRLPLSQAAGYCGTAGTGSTQFRLPACNAQGLGGTVGMADTMVFLPKGAGFGYTQIAYRPADTTLNLPLSQGVGE